MTHYGLLPAGAGDGKAPSEAQLRSVVNALEIKRFESHFEDFRKTPDITANRLKDPLLLFLKTSPGQLLSDLGEIKGFLMLWDMYPPELGDGTNLTEKDIQKVVDLLVNFSVKAYAYRAIGKLPKFNAPGFDSAPNESMKLVLANLGIKDVPFVDMNATSWKKEEWRLIHLKVLEAYQKMPGEVPSSPAPAPTPSDPGQTPSPGQPTKPWAPVQAATRSMSAAHAALLDRIINETGAGFPVLLPPEIQAFLANWGVKLNGIDPTQPLDLGQTRQVATYLETMSKTFSTKNYVQSVIDGLPQFYSPNFSGADSEAIKRALKNLGIETIPGVDMNKAVFGYNEFVLVLIKLKSIQQQI
jgi:hypothetical protein